MPRSNQISAARCRLAVVTRDHGPVDPVTCAVRREFRSEKYLWSVRVVGDAAPLIDRLKQEQRPRVAAPLRSLVPAAEGGAR